MQENSVAADAGSRIIKELTVESVRAYDTQRKSKYYSHETDWMMHSYSSKGRRKKADNMTSEIDGRAVCSVICRHNGIKAREIADILHADRRTVNQILYRSPLMKELCYQDRDYCWHGIMKQARPHIGLQEFAGYYATAEEFTAQTEEEWLASLTEGCKNIGRNLNDTRGLIHSFRDTREVLIRLFSDLEALDDAIDYDSWEICFELRIKRARYIRIYADVLVITQNKVFSLEFKMKDVIDPDEELQAVKYARYLEVIFGEEYEVIPALVLTRASDLYSWEQLPGSTAEVPVCSGDMLFNLFDEFIGFLG